MLIKKFVLGLINKVFGLNISSDQLDAFMSFIAMLIEVFGTATQAVAFVKQTTVQARQVGNEKAKVALTGMQKTMAGAA